MRSRCVQSLHGTPSRTIFILQREKERRAAEEKRIQEGSRLRKQREQLTAELNEVKSQLAKRHSLEEMKTLMASYNVNVS